MKILKSIFLWILNFVFRRVKSGSVQQYIGGFITEVGGVHPDALPSEEVVIRFKGERAGPNTHKFKGGRKRIREEANSYVRVGARLRKRKNSGHSFLLGGVRCKKKSARAQAWIMQRFEKVV